MALNRARPRENRKNENDFDKPVKKMKLEACTGKKFTNSIEIKSNHEDKKIVFKEIDVFIKDQVKKVFIFKRNMWLFIARLINSKKIILRSILLKQTWLNHSGGI